MKKKYKKIRKYAGLYIMLAIPFLWYIIFKYIPMYGLQIAFKRFNPTLGITKSPWVGLTYFKQFFDSYYFGNILWNTVSRLFDCLDSAKPRHIVRIQNTGGRFLQCQKFSGLFTGFLHISVGCFSDIVIRNLQSCLLCCFIKRC